MVDGKYKLLLIREETGCPSKQLCQWADVLLLVFSYSNEDSLFQVCGVGGEGWEGGRRRERGGREEGWEEKRGVGGREGGEGGKKEIWEGVGSSIGSSVWMYGRKL